MNQNQKVIDYYNKSQLEYNVVLALRKHLGMHYGYFEKGIKNIPQAVLNMNRVLATKAGITKNMTVMDAGCGIGGTAIWLAENIGCRVTGITLVKHQVNRAEKLAKKHGVERMTKFLVKDFTETKFHSNSFDAILALESVVHSKILLKFFREAFRLLKPGGKLAISVYYSEKKNLDSKEKNLINSFCKGWILPQLYSKLTYFNLLEKSGFVSINFEDTKDHILPYSKWLYDSCRKWTIPAKIGFRLRILNKAEINNREAALAQYEALLRDLWRHAIIDASKPLDN